MPVATPSNTVPTKNVSRYCRLSPGGWRWGDCLWLRTASLKVISGDLVLVSTKRGLLKVSRKVFYLTKLWKVIFPTIEGKHAMFIVTGRHPWTLDEERHGSHDIPESLNQPVLMFALPLGLILNNVPSKLAYSSCFPVFLFSRTCFCLSACSLQLGALFALCVLFSVWVTQQIPLFSCFYVLHEG